MMYSCVDHTCDLISCRPQACRWVCHWISDVCLVYCQSTIIFRAAEHYFWLIWNHTA